MLIGLAAAMVLAGQATTGPTPRGDPTLWVTPNDYPPSLENPPSQTIVGFRLDVGVDGRVTGCSIVKSSGYAPLDATACRLLRQRARFDPATDAAGTAVAGQWPGSIRWVLPD
jgi:protein TonB